MSKKYKFTVRKPSKPYVKTGHYLQFWVEIVELRETKEIELEDSSKKTIVVAYYYKKYELPWREEFNKTAEYGENGELLKQDYITEHYESLLAEAKQF